jgi:plasmid maintenance system antidote protein VapI
MNRRDLFKFLAGIGLGAVAIETYERLYHIPMLETMFRKELEYWINQYNTAREEVERLTGQLREREGEISSLRSDLTRSKEELEHLIQQYNTTKEEANRLSEMLKQSVEEINNLREKVGYWEARYNTAREEVGRLNSIINKLDELERESTSAIEYYRGRMDEAIRKLKEIIERYRVLLGDERVSFESSTVKILEDLKLTQEKLQKVLPYFPLILDFGWKPIRVINDKIYDINISFEVISPLNSLKEVEVILIPVEYRYFITKYGMREEDYHRVFPKEEIRNVKIEPRKLEREMFSVDFEDLKGGREYIVKARVKDVAGSEKIVEVKTPYIRQFENIAKTDDILVIVPYYLWYRPDLSNWKDGHKYTSLLGEYRSDDSIVHSKHIDWATGYGIDVFLVSWDGYNSNKDIQYFNNNLKLLFRNELSKDIKIAILYEGLKFKTTGNPQKPWERDISDPHNLEILLSDFKYLADNYFNDENYFRIEGKPVVYIYGSATYINTKDALEKLQEIMREKIGKEVFLISDHVTPHFFPGQKPEWEREARSFEGTTSWLGGYSPSGEYLGGSYEVQIDKMYSEWFKWTLENKKLHMPSTTPEFDNRYVKWGNPTSIPLERSPENFRKRLEIILKYTNYPRVISLGTWNDFLKVQH